MDIKRVRTHLLRYPVESSGTFSSELSDAILRGEELQSSGYDGDGWWAILLEKTY